MQDRKINRNIKKTDLLSTEQLVEVMYAQTIFSMKNIKKIYGEISASIDLISSILKKGGNLYFIGAGASGRNAIIEFLETKNNFSLKKDMLKTVIAGGNRAFLDLDNAFQDFYEYGRADVFESLINSNDVLIAIDIDENCQYTKGVLEYAKEENISTILFTNNQNPKDDEYSTIRIYIPTNGDYPVNMRSFAYPVVIKSVLKMILTGVMVKLGKTYKKYVIDPNPQKFKQKAIKIVKKFAKVKTQKAVETLEKCSFRPKIAIVMLIKKLDLKEAINLIKENDGMIYEIIEEFTNQNRQEI